ncbi:universal stress protein [Catenulispora subtropica]|uniref:Universal stress protein n=1 Tax=Catenulispora subtropica TaxID=450798 RepID=A0ABP5DGI3_9ACTN
MSGTVIVGYDQSEPSEQSLMFAAREAELRGATLVVFHGYHFTRRGAALIPPAALQQVYEDAGLRIAEIGVEHVRSRFPDLAVRSGAEAGLHARMLAEAGENADLIVVGNRGRGGFTGLLLGSVSMRTLGAARCPVVVVRGGEHGPRGRVVAAVDIDGPAAETVLDFAFDEASLHHADLVAAYAWDQDAPLILDATLGTAALGEAAQTIIAACDDRLAALVQKTGARHPEVASSHHAATASPAGLLVAESQYADLLVVGARRHSHDHPGMRIGPVAAAVLHHAECPVAVAPAPAGSDGTKP